MARTLYLDCFSGISGDMLLGALVDAGVPLNTLKRELRKIPLKGYSLSLTPVIRGGHGPEGHGPKGHGLKGHGLKGHGLKGHGLKGREIETNALNRASGISAAKLDVKLSSTQAPARRLRDVRALIKSSTLSPAVRKRGLLIFNRIFEAEALVHGSTAGRVHLHELGAVDALVDIMGAVICLDALGVQRLLCSPLNLGSGTVSTAHGILPVPAPATAELLKGVPVYSDGDGELTTPTGAAIVAALAQGFGSMPAMTIESVGTGAGGRDAGERPNVLRAFLGDAPEAGGAGAVTVIEANIDDMNPEIYGHVMDLLFAAGALDVWLTPVIMKKTRPGIVLSAICPEQAAQALMQIVLLETSTLGLRHYTAERCVLERRTRSVKTPFGAIRVKDACMADGRVKSAPEYEDARAAALKHGVPLRDVMAEALRSAKSRGKG